MGRPSPRWIAVVAALIAAGCLPREVPIIGSACDDAHPCGGDLVCVGDVCSADAGTPSTEPPNLLANGDFEKGPAGWRGGEASTVTVQQDVSRSGFAAKVDHTGTNDYFSLVLERIGLQSAQSGKTYCGQAWVQRGTTQKPLTLMLRGWASGGGFAESSNDTPGARVTPLDNGWHRIVNLLVLTPPNDVQLNLRIFTPTAGNGTTFYVDDVRVWEDPTGMCTPVD